ncbi:hypothetical protein H310_13351 [Aphanomyces invadans]|uniref:Uncharacterized protein n=1 Tax=Aphanomyces invadans TaxID=157072 RepID=A0A024TE19_9STRA|nr:hypothetical protein H310_13351 [Aphanomyces invadans]ETV92293.1 hypothetical protein H310_13351 [Aphanomyces invadans]|eukprot:XP_008879044.1 hypothetical protein H310_13351 [Aphanomyces invadans]
MPDDLARSLFAFRGQDADRSMLAERCWRVEVRYVVRPKLQEMVPSCLSQAMGALRYLLGLEYVQKWGRHQSRIVCIRGAAWRRLGWRKQLTGECRSALKW